MSGKVYTLAECQALPDGSQLKYWCYNALDSTGTREIFDVLYPRLTPQLRWTYEFERSLQNPAFAMMNRGVLIDVYQRDKMVTLLRRELRSAITAIGKHEELKQWDMTEKETGFCAMRPVGATGKAPHHKWQKWEKGADEHGRKCELCGTSRLRPKPFNPNSPDHADHLFYELLGVPVMTNKLGKRSTDEDVLQRIGKKYPKYRALTDAILDIRDKGKQIGSLTARLTKSNRYPSSFNPGAAWTGRFSSSANPYREGGNLQNWAERHRRVAIPDPGFDIGYADFKTGESKGIAYMAGDEKYIEAHEGDTHTFVARLVWPDLPWTGDIKQDKKIAKSTYPEWDNVAGHDLRFQSKAVQHGSNLGLTPRGISLQKKIPMDQAERAQASYFRAFPFIRGYQNWIAEGVREHRPITNPLGRTVTLFGRPWDNHTINQGYAFLPQSLIADLLDLSMWRVWWYMDPGEVQILAQVHDAILFQYPTGRLDILKKMAKLMTIPIDITDYRGNTRRMVIDVEVASGGNWGHKCVSKPGAPCAGGDNPHGLEDVEL